MTAPPLSLGGGSGGAIRSNNLRFAGTSTKVLVINFHSSEPAARAIFRPT